MSRIPSPELVSFLLCNWPFSEKTLLEVSRETIWNTNPDLKSQLESVIQTHDSRRVRDFVQPIVLCLFAGGQKGKTTFGHLLGNSRLQVFQTDAFVADLRGEWHDDEELRGLARKTVPNCVNEFILWVESSEVLAGRFIELLFNPQHGFNSTAPVSVIEGFLHDPRASEPEVRLTDAIIGRLRITGYRVWVATPFTD